MKKLVLLFVSFVTILSVSAQYDLKTPNTIIVDKAGSGHFKTIQQAFDSVRAFNPVGTVTIFIKKGVYKEKLIIPSHIVNLHVIGEDREKTVIDFDDHANKNKMGTFRTYTLKILGDLITLENLTIQNSSEPLGQAVALHVEGDKIYFKNCRFLGNQDTIYLGKANTRQLFLNCYIEGTTDFIFGPSTAWFEACTIHCKRNSYITAANTPEDVAYGFIFNKCKITLAPEVTDMYLGRPWRAYSMTVFMNCDLPKGIKAQGWDNWKNPANEKTVRYCEYKNTGEGADLSKRVKWCKILSKKEASKLTIKNVLKRQDSWMPM